MALRLSSSRERPVTSSRPISSRSRTGFTSSRVPTTFGKEVIDPLGRLADSFSQFLKDTEDAPDNQVKKFKKDIYDKMEESSTMLATGKLSEALQSAKAADTLTKQLQDFLTSKAMEDNDFKSLRHSTLLQLANAYKDNSMYDEALSRYNRILKDREFPTLYLVYLEIGNIYSTLQKYPEAVKNYQMGINHLKHDQNKFLARFHFSCGVAYSQMGDLPHALSSFEMAMRFDPAVKSGYNLVLCTSAMSSIETLRDSYCRMVAVKPSSNVADVNESDVLGNLLHVERKEQIRLIMLASRLVASKADKNWIEAYEFVLEHLKKSKFPEACGEFEIAYSLAHLNHKNANKAIEMLRMIRKKDPSLMALAATNLSFLYFVEQDYENANKYADIALSHDKYNAQALVNKGNCYFQAENEEAARDSYLEAIGVEADCAEGLFNLGIVCKMMGSIEEALQVFEKMNRLVPESPEVAFELSDCYDRIGDVSSSIDWLHRLVVLLPADPAIWKRLGDLWDREGNETQAFHCYSESFRFYPSDIDVISWLGRHFMKNSQYGEALKFFQRASAIVPSEPRYMLMVAACFRQMDSKQEALEVYEKVLQKDPNNVECLKHLAKLATEMKLTSKADHYQRMLVDLTERIAQMQEEQAQEENEYNDMQYGMMPNNQYTPYDNPAPFARNDDIEGGSLQLNVHDDQEIEKARAGRQQADIWEGVDIDLDE